MNKPVDVAETLVEEADAIGPDLVFDDNGDLIALAPSNDNGEKPKK